MLIENYKNKQTQMVENHCARIGRGREIKKRDQITRPLGNENALHLFK